MYKLQQQRKQRICTKNTIPLKVNTAWRGSCLSGGLCSQSACCFATVLSIYSHFVSTYGYLMSLCCSCKTLLSPL